MTVSTDLHAMLRDELGHLEEDRARIDAKMAAIHLLLETANDTPAATFTADDAREHDAGKPSDPVKPKAKATRKGLRANFSPEMIDMIRKRAKAGDTYAVLAEKSGYSRATIGNVVNRKGWYA